MKIIQLFLILIFTVNLGFAQINPDVFKFKAKIGFESVDDSIINHQFVDDGKKVFLLGQRNIQLWDVENAKLLSSVPHNIPQLAPQGFFSAYILLGLPRLMTWQLYRFQLDGGRFISLEKQGNNKFKSAVVRDLQTAKQVATLDLPDSISTDWITIDEKKNEIITIGKDDKNFALAKWDRNTLQPKKAFTINDYRWHQLIRNEEKIIVGTGGSDFSWLGSQKLGNLLTLRDVKSGLVEKQFTAPNFSPKSVYQFTAVSLDEKFLISRRDKRILVWEIGGNSSPKFEISTANPKENPELVKVFGNNWLAVIMGEKLRIYDLNGNGSPKFEFIADKSKYLSFFSGSSKHGKYFAVYSNGKQSVYETTGDGKPLYEIAPQSKDERIGKATFWDDENLVFFSRSSGRKDEKYQTEFYNIATGKLEFTVPFAVGDKFAFTPDRKFFYSELTGSTAVWNFAESKPFYIRLRTEAYEYLDTSGNTAYGADENVEFTALSADAKFILKYGKYVVSVYDIATGEEIQTIFDAERVKYDKQNRLKDSGLDKAGWTENGKFVYAYSKNRKILYFWKVNK